MWSLAGSWQPAGLWPVGCDEDYSVLCRGLSVAVYAGSLVTCVLYTVFLSRGSIEGVYWTVAGMG